MSESREWCEHCKMGSGNNEYGWGFINHQRISMLDWVGCPICKAKFPEVAKRPEQRKELRDVIFNSSFYVGTFGHAEYIAQIAHAYYAEELKRVRAETWDKAIEAFDRFRPERRQDTMKPLSLTEYLGKAKEEDLNSR